MRSVAVFMLLCTACTAQVSAPQSKEIFRNHRVTVSTLELAPRESTKSPRARDFLVVFINDGRIQNKLLSRKLLTDQVDAGEVRYQKANSPFTITNEGDTPLHLVFVDFTEPQGKLEKLGTRSHTCDPGSATACWDEHNLFCTKRVCVEDVVIAANTITHKHSHATDHMMVAVSDYELKDEVEGKGTVIRTRKSGEMEYIPAGITHQITNSGKAPAHFTVVLWR
jgi:mannose-6-phosphate isomerase-like protein (cupin superfamily)